MDNISPTSKSEGPPILVGLLYSQCARSGLLLRCLHGDDLAERRRAGFGACPQHWVPRFRVRKCSAKGLSGTPSPAVQCRVAPTTQSKVESRSLLRQPARERSADQPDRGSRGFLLMVGDETAAGTCCGSNSALKQLRLDLCGSREEATLLPTRESGQTVRGHLPGAGEV
jgi:hypothetical protein